MSLSTVQTYPEAGQGRGSLHGREGRHHTDWTCAIYDARGSRRIRKSLDTTCSRGRPADKTRRTVPDPDVRQVPHGPRGNIVIDGAALPFQAMLRHSQGHRYYDYTADAVQWASMSLPVEQFASAGIAIGGCDLLPPRDPLVVIPSAVAMTGLRQLHSEASALAQHAPWLLAVPEVAHGLEQSLIEALVGCLNQSEVNEASWGQRCHETIMRRSTAFSKTIPTGLSTSRKSAQRSECRSELRVLLPGPSGIEPQAVSAAAAHAPGASSTQRRDRCKDDGHRDRDTLRILALQPVRRNLSVDLRRAAVRHAPQAATLIGAIRLIVRIN